MNKLIYIVSLWGLILTGCVASRLPNKLAPLSLQEIHAAKLPFHVSIEEYEYPAYSESLEKNLDNTRLFKSVDELNETSTPDLIAKVEDRIYGTACVPWLTFLSVGIIPTFVEENHGDSFSLSSPKKPDDKVKIIYRYRGTTVLGWLGLFYNLHPDWWMFPESSQRYLDSLSYSIITKADGIKSLTEPSSPARE